MIIRTVLEDYKDSARFVGKRGSLKLYNEINEALVELEELEVFKSEHLRLEGELNQILHPNGDAPSAPSFSDLVCYVRNDITVKTCNWDGRILTTCGRRLTRDRGFNFPNFCPYCGGKVVRK